MSAEPQCLPRLVEWQLNYPPDPCLFIAARRVAILAILSLVKTRSTGDDWVMEPDGDAVADRACVCSAGAPMFKFNASVGGEVDAAERLPVDHAMFRSD